MINMGVGAEVITLWSLDRKGLGYRLSLKLFWACNEDER